MSRLLLVAALLSGAVPTPADAAGYGRVDVCFALDTTGSMSSLIATAKEKIWFIANEIVNAPGHPGVRFCLMGYRDREDAYVTRHFDLTDDLDAIHASLLEFRADGGGDTPEAVNQALLETVENSSWDTSPEVLKLIFLVGDAPPKVYADELQYDRISELAFDRNIIINPVLCGTDAQTWVAWQTIANNAEGEALRMDDAAATERVWTPMDTDLAILGARLERMAIPYGPANVREELDDTRKRVEKLDDAIAADRISFKSTAGDLTHHVDLVSSLESGSVSMDDLDPDWLPEQVRSMSRDELEAHLQTVANDRARISRLIQSLVSERREYVIGRRRGDGFESLVSELVLRQLKGGSL